MRPKSENSHPDSLGAKQERNPRRPGALGGELKTGTETDGWPIFDSMAQCEAKTRIPKDRLVDWKAAGAPGFRSGRIYFGELLPWMSERMFRPTTNGDEYEPPILSYADKLDKQKYLERAGILIESSKAKGYVRTVLAPLRQFIFSIPKVMAPRCNPTDPLLAQTELERHIRQGMQMIADGEREKLGNQ